MLATKYILDYTQSKLKCDYKAHFMLHLSELYLSFRLMEQSNVDMT